MDQDRSDRESALQVVDSIISTGAAQGVRVSEQITNQIRRSVTKEMSPLEILAIVRRILTDGEPLLGRALEHSIVAGWLAGGEHVAKRLPKAKSMAGEEPPVPPPGRVIIPGEPEPEMEFPIIEEAAASLAARRLLTAAEFYQAGEAARAKAFAVAQVASRDTLAKIQEYLTEDIETGGTLKAFHEFMKEETALAPGRVENVYRNNVGSSFCRGQEKIADHWQVKSALPYVMNAHINDSRTTELCRIISKSGIGGGPVFRADDKVWVHFRPLRHHGCRCSSIYLTVDDCAKRGIPEAMVWKTTGIEPIHPAWVEWPDVELPPGWVPGGGG